MQDEARKRFVDGILVTWGEDLFQGRVKPRKAGTKDLFQAKKGRGGKASSYKPMSAEAVRQHLRDTFRKVPEVTVKITGTGKHMKHIKSHMDYISRNGEKTLEDQDGNLIIGKDELLDLRDSWRDGRHVIPSEQGTKRESFNIVLSMPKGTNREGLHNAARDFSAEQFGGKYEYAFVSHDDTDHPHAHLIVKAQGIDGKRLNPRKADLQQWRQRFAEKLREHGIEANATKRKTRGVTKNPDRIYAVKQDRKERAGQALERYIPRNSENPSNPFAQKSKDTHGKVLRNYKHIAEALQGSPDVEDRKLAVELVRYVQTMPVELAHAKASKVQIVEKAPERSRPEPGIER